MNKMSRQKCKYFENEGLLGLSLKQMNKIFLEGESPILKTLTMVK